MHPPQSTHISTLPIIHPHIRPYTPQDTPALRALMQIAYTDLGGDCATEAELLQLHHLYPQGQIVAYIGETLVGAAISRRIPFARYQKHHTMIDSNDISRYQEDDAQGESIYMLDVFTDNRFRKHNIARLCAGTVINSAFEDNVPRVIGGSRAPNYHKYADQMSIDNYVQRVQNGSLRDPILDFQLAMSAFPFACFADYSPADAPSCGYGIGVAVTNPHHTPHQPIRRRPHLP